VFATYIDAAYKHENVSLFATLIFLREQALEITGRVFEARKARLDTAAFARYGLGSEEAVNR
jgi:hypothetical protein